MQTVPLISVADPGGVSGVQVYPKISCVLRAQEYITIPLLEILDPPLNIVQNDAYVQNQILA